MNTAAGKPVCAAGALPGSMAVSAVSGRISAVKSGQMSIRNSVRTDRSAPSPDGTAASQSGVDLACGAMLLTQAGGYGKAMAISRAQWSRVGPADRVATQ